jgi:hypothetical protein
MTTGRRMTDVANASVGGLMESRGRSLTGGSLKNRRRESLPPPRAWQILPATLPNAFRILVC